MNRILLALLLLAPVATPRAAWMQVYQYVHEPPDVRNPPPGWQQATLPPGTPFPFYAYEQFTTEYDWTTGIPIGRRLVWKRACFFLPAQRFAMLQLQPDNSWRKVSTIRGPILYIALDAPDGDAKVFRLEAE